jgi:membrane protein required for colicin V production
MNGLDWGIVAILVISVLLAAAQGFLHEVIALAGAVAGYLIAAWEYWRVARWLGSYVNSEPVAQIVAFLAIFFAVIIAAGIIGRIAHWLARAAGLGWFDRLLGAVFGLVRGAVMVAVLVLALTAFAPGSQLLERSAFAGYFLVEARGMSWLAPASLRQKVRQGVAAMREAAGRQPARH